MRGWVWMFALLVACDDGAANEPGQDAAAQDLAVDQRTAPDGSTDMALDLGPDASADMAPPDPDRPYAERTFAAPTAWATPLADYITAGEAAFPEQAFERGIHDLATFDGRLHLGYGDATLNLGRVVAIEHRAFTDPEDAASLVTEAASREEHLDGFRRFGERLMLPGIDAVDDAWLGNVYLRDPGQPWRMARTVDRGVHVHDVVQWGASLYAVGSGATPEAWNNGNVYAHLWISRDDAQSWQVLHTVHNERMGDARFVRLLPLDDALYTFGYRSDAMGSINRLLAGAWDGTIYTPLAAEHPLSRAFVVGTEPLSATAGLVWGADVAADPLVSRVWRLEGGLAAPVEALAGHTLVDLSRVEATGEWLLLVHAGDTWAMTPDPWEAQVWVAPPDLSAASEVLRFTAPAPVKSVAAWGGALFLGDAQGTLWKAEVE